MMVPPLWSSNLGLTEKLPTYLTQRPRGFEAAGSVNLLLSCGPAQRARKRGQHDTVCTVAQNGGTVAANFTSLEPTPS